MKKKLEKINSTNVRKSTISKQKTSYPKMKKERIFVYVAALIVLTFLMVPIIVIPILSFGTSTWLEFPPPGYTMKWYKTLFSSSEWFIPIVNSLKIAIPVVFLSTVFGIPIAYAIVRGKFKGRKFLNSLFVTPMMMPYIIFAIAIYGVYLNFGLTGTYTGIVIAHVILVLPFVITNVANSFRTLNPAIEQAALSCGAGYFTTFFRVTLPLIKNGVVAGAIYAFFLSWDEIIVAIFITTPDTITLPVKIWNSLRMDLSPVLAAIATLLILVSTIILVITTFFGNAFSIPSGGQNEKKGDK